MSQRRIGSSGAHPTPLLLVLALAGALLALPATPATGSTCDGVWVVVDASELGGGVQTRCAPGDPSSGLDALESAGFSYAFVPRQQGMVCTIDGRPDPCNGAPTSAYWSYWHASPGGDWRYGSEGAGSRDPAPGSVEGWAFGAGDPPSQAPPAEKAPADDGDDGDDGGGSADGGSRDDASPSPSEDEDPADEASPPDGSPATSTSSGDAEEPSPSREPEEDAPSADDDAGADPPEEESDDDPADPRTDTDDATPDDEATGRERTDLAERRRAEATDPDDAVAVDAGGGGGAGLVGVGVGATLVTAIAGAAVLRARRNPGLDVDA